MSRNLLFALLGLITVGIVGCGKSGYARVSGVVTFKGKPYRNALVLFQPMAIGNNADVGRGSSGFTDEDGRFTLKSVDGDNGAVVGKHRIRITTKYSDKLKGYEVWDNNLNKMVKAVDDPIPATWNYESKKEFTVPAGGTDKADFDIVE